MGMSAPFGTRGLDFRKGRAWRTVPLTSAWRDDSYGASAQPDE